MKTAKYVISLILTLSLVLTMFSGCSDSGNNAESVITNGSAPVQTTNDSKETEPPTQEEIEEQKAFSSSTPENDTDVGLKTIKIDTADQDLTDDQRNVIKFFDNDYFDIYDYEFLRRYPKVFQNSQVSVHGIVNKVLSQTDTQYEILLNIGNQFSDGNTSELLCLRGDTDGMLMIENDEVNVHGLYSGIETMEVDGSSVTVPVIKVYDAYIFGSGQRFDYKYIKSTAKTIFGEDIEVRTLNGEKSEGLVYPDDYYAVELENQSNAKFSTFYFDLNNGTIWDESMFDYTSSIERHIEFSGDFEHFYVISYDHGTYTFTLECYDRQLNKTWKRDFEEIQPPETEGLMDRIYDFTKNNFYLALNNELYIINAQTGEDTFPPLYVGNKVAVSKVRDGIIMIANSKSDSIMKIDLNGQMIWRTNTGATISNVFSIQVNDEHMVAFANTHDDDHNYYYRYYVLDSESGAMLEDAVTIQ